MEFRILGPVEVRSGDGPLSLGGDKQRALLALLVLHRREPVSTDRLIDGLWGDDAPPTAVKTVQVYVSRLRKALGNGVIETRGHGYRLAAPPEDVDVDRFETALAAARATRAPDRRAALLRDALALWRGPALSDVAYEPFARDAAARLEELHVAAREELIDARLALGEDEEVVPELEALIHQHPMRERLYARLMIALYRSGRQGDALQAYRDARRTLVGQLGVEPGPELERLEHAVLDHDPALAGPPRRDRRRRGGAVAERRRGPPVLLLAAAGAAVALVVLAAVVLDRGGGEADTVTLGRDTVGALSPATGEIESAVRVPRGPGRLAVGRGLVWVGAVDAQVLAAIDVARPRLTDIAAPGALPTDVAATPAGDVWLLDREHAELLHVRGGRPGSRRRVRLHDAPRGPFIRDRSLPQDWSLAAGYGRAWVTDGSSRLRIVDARSGATVRSVDAGRPLHAVATGEGAVWAISASPASVLEFAPDSGRLRARIAIPRRRGFATPYPLAVEAGEGAVWVLNGNTGNVVRIDPRRRIVTARVAVGADRAPVRLAAGAGAVWVACRDGTLTRIDPADGETAVTTLGRTLADVAVAGDRVWVSAGAG